MRVQSTAGWARLAGFMKRVWHSLTSMLTVMVSPRRTFEYLKQLQPFLLVWIVGAVVKSLQFAGIYHRVGIDAITRYSLSQAPEMKMTDDQIQAMDKSAAIMYPLRLISSPLMWIVGVIIVATVLFEIDRRLLKNGRSFRQVLSIVSYAKMPSIIFSIAICIVIWSNSNPLSLHIGALLGTNAGLLIPPSSVPPFYRTILGSLDVWAIWSVLLLGIGLSSEKIRIGKTLSYVGVLWLLWIVTVAGFSALMAHIAVKAMTR